MIDDDLMRDAIDEMRQRKVHIVIWTETHFKEKHSLMFEEIAEKKGYKTFSITRCMRRFDKGSGESQLWSTNKFRVEKLDRAN